MSRRSPRDVCDGWQASTPLMFSVSIASRDEEHGDAEGVFGSIYSSRETHCPRIVEDFVSPQTAFRTLLSQDAKGRKNEGSR